ncbi:hypothetical protein [Clostridium botulinum]|uniref:Conserved domain protein n=1 Tax=Clostridium botulinum (strain Langeland / NCTC 10281 / Type F) TaxID=441772 RepID=A7GFW4_CLOBL|nr:hypothetical protein [Clostridium botulinum]ABS42733.1 conserved domain protein [Clostridium botulinum F str. Langeland]ADG00083.1 conserved domain protein [Clostridium botulinum F str. 230613]KKM42368.1 hypothetical protein VT72_01630 [Clostridium botulinum]MBY6793153.1 hypothetical protein [Clostridium botulinum]MBY6937363.1 hypothetical protein [Clostridium botulinum]
MYYKFTDTEIKKLLKEKFMILYDTREQKNQHILNYFDEKKVKYKRKKIDEGDYTAIITKLCKLNLVCSLVINIRSN